MPLKILVSPTALLKNPVTKKLILLGKKMLSKGGKKTLRPPDYGMTLTTLSDKDIVIVSAKECLLYTNNATPSHVKNVYAATQDSVEGMARVSYSAEQNLLSADIASYFPVQAPADYKGVVSRLLDVYQINRVTDFLNSVYLSNYSPFKDIVFEVPAMDFYDLDALYAALGIAGTSYTAPPYFTVRVVDVHEDSATGKMFFAATGPVVVVARIPPSGTSTVTTYQEHTYIVRVIFEFTNVDLTNVRVDSSIFGEEYRFKLTYEDQTTPEIRGVIVDNTLLRVTNEDELNTDSFAIGIALDIPENYFPIDVTRDSKGVVTACKLTDEAVLRLLHTASVVRDTVYLRPFAHHRFNVTLMEVSPQNNPTRDDFIVFSGFDNQAGKYATVKQHDTWSYTGVVASENYSANMTSPPLIAPVSQVLTAKGYASVQLKNALTGVVSASAITTSDGSTYANGSVTHSGDGAVKLGRYIDAFGDRHYTLECRYDGDDNAHGFRYTSTYDGIFAPLTVPELGLYLGLSGFDAVKKEWIYGAPLATPTEYVDKWLLKEDLTTTYPFLGTTKVPYLDPVDSSLVPYYQKYNDELAQALPAANDAPYISRAVISSAMSGQHYGEVKTDRTDTSYTQRVRTEYSASYYDAYADYTPETWREPSRVHTDNCALIVLSLKDETKVAVLRLHDELPLLGTDLAVASAAVKNTLFESAFHTYKTARDRVAARHTFPVYDSPESTYVALLKVLDAHLDKFDSVARSTENVSVIRDNLYALHKELVVALRVFRWTKWSNVTVDDSLGDLIWSYGTYYVWPDI